MQKEFRSFAVVFNVADIDRTEQFYREVLGITLTRQPGENEGDWLYKKFENGLEFIFFQGNDEVGRSPIIVFGLDEGDIDTVVEEIAKKGGEIVTPVSEAPGGWSADFRDPDGHILSLYQEENLPRRKKK